MITLDARSTALLLIDLQQRILALPTAPRPADDVLRASEALAARFRAAAATVVRVDVAFAREDADTARLPIDRRRARTVRGRLAGRPDRTEGPAPAGDLRITKRRWGAFTGTVLDMQLRRRGIRTLVLGGIATDFGVESPARHVRELGYDVIVAEDAFATVGPAETYATALAHILPGIARIVAAETLAFG